ncbi:MULTISPECIES: DedA family protein [unclassified Streptomyces]|uniref:DedA family protein n=1 Tax=unclassified Streptomyces TaxID=2593676 RepID=UPI002254B159|nr:MULTISPECIES: VTT domain-containing protein [unclassified Streptomyces]MCX4989408.1 VTT domain-containing protein [Streptomyces sp. NBC_00568]MCX5005370.1 VTT domain-containing protein [Streptomyces sp. NBC_00638]
MTTLALGPSWLDPNTLLDNFGIWGLLLIVFAESGLLIGFFLPGDSLLFTCGLLITAGTMDFPLWAAIPLICLAAILGDQAGYLFGKKVGPSLFTRPNSRLFKQENVVKAHEFFEKYGPKSLVLARFVPIVRTFTPIIAGVSGMKYRPFLIFNIIGGILWGAGVTLLGSWLGGIDFVNKNIEAILILIVLVSVVPIIIEFLRARSQAKKNPPQESVPAQPAADRTRPAAPVMDDATRPLRVPPVQEGQDSSYGYQGHGQSYGHQGHDGSYGNHGNQGHDAYGNQGGSHGQGYGHQGNHQGQQGQQGQQGNGYPHQQQHQEPYQQPYGSDQGYGYDQQYDQGYQQGYDQGYDQGRTYPPQQQPQGHPQQQYGSEQYRYGQGPAQN